MHSVNLYTCFKNIVKRRKYFGRYYKNCIRDCIGNRNFICLLICIGLYLINTLVLRWHFEFCRSYFNDILAMPILLTYSAMLFKRYKVEFPIVVVWGLFVICSIVWEYVYPIINFNSVSDIYDIVSYFAGTCAWLFLNSRRK
jgi:hypothetical protein